jgi:hypothetical protein
MAGEFTDLFINFYIRLHSLPDTIISDRDFRFNSRFWKYLTRLWETKLAFSTAFHPQTDGQAEKANLIIKRFLRAFLTNKQRSWDTLLVIAELLIIHNLLEYLLLKPILVISLECIWIQWLLLDLDDHLEDIQE